MSDWGKGATSKKKQSAVEAIPFKLTELKCEKCGKVWWFKHQYDYELRQAQDEYGRTFCVTCLPRGNNKTRHTPSPPPASMQISIEEKYGAKK